MSLTIIDVCEKVYYFSLKGLHDLPLHLYTQALPGDLTNSNTSGFGPSGENWVCSMGCIPILPWSKKE